MRPLTPAMEKAIKKIDYFFERPGNDYFCLWRATKQVGVRADTVEALARRGYCKLSGSKIYGYSLDKRNWRPGALDRIVEAL